MGNENNDQLGRPPVATTYRYEKPEIAEGRGKAIQMLGRSDLAFVAVQVIRRGGENNLHAHTNVDGFWTVLKGRVRFYTTDDELIGDLGPMEGIVIPRNYPYWFESCGDVDLEILQVEASTERWEADTKPETGRFDIAPRREGQVAASMTMAPPAG